MTGEEVVEATIAAKMTPAIESATSGPINLLLSAAVPSEARAIPEIQDKLNEAKQSIKNEQAKMVNEVSGTAGSVAIKTATAIPFAGAIVAGASIVDRVVGAVRKVTSRFGKIKNRIKTLKREVCQAMAAAAAAKNASCSGMPHLGLPKISLPFGSKGKVAEAAAATAAHANKKGGGTNKKTKKMSVVVRNTATSSNALDRTRRAMEYFHEPTNSKKQIHTRKHVTSPTHLKTRKLYANKILERTGHSIRAFSG